MNKTTTMNKTIIIKKPASDVARDVIEIMEKATRNHTITDIVIGWTLEGQLQTRPISERNELAILCWDGSEDRIPSKDSLQILQINWNSQSERKWVAKCLTCALETNSQCKEVRIHQTQPCKVELVFKEVYLHTKVTAHETAKAIYDILVSESEKRSEARYEGRSKARALCENLDLVIGWTKEGNLESRPLSKSKDLLLLCWCGDWDCVYEAFGDDFLENPENCIQKIEYDIQQTGETKHITVYTNALYSNDSDPHDSHDSCDSCDSNPFIHLEFGAGDAGLVLK